MSFHNATGLADKFVRLHADDPSQSLPRNVQFNDDVRIRGSWEACTRGVSAHVCTR